MNVIVIVYSIIITLMLIWNIIMEYYKEEEYKNLYEEVKYENELLKREIYIINNLKILNDRVSKKNVRR